MARLTAYDLLPDCCWPTCQAAQISPALPLCQLHAWQAFVGFRDILEAQDAPPKPDPYPPLVYYLALSPQTIKIGTTRNLPLRLCGLRTELQYVLAVESGGFELEAQRHREFAAERIGRREDFRMSDRLMAHIDGLQHDSKGLMDMHEKARR